MRSSYEAVLNVFDCDIVASEFEFQSRYYDHFLTDPLGKGMKPISTATVLLQG